jgi:hypothetical protein
MLAAGLIDEVQAELARGTGQLRLAWTRWVSRDRGDARRAPGPADLRDAIVRSTGPTRSGRNVVWNQLRYQPSAISRQPEDVWFWMPQTFGRCAHVERWLTVKADG